MTGGARASPQGPPQYTSCLPITVAEVHPLPLPSPPGCSTSRGFRQGPSPSILRKSLQDHCAELSENSALLDFQESTQGSNML